mgnify:CR=1 FL=1
MLAVTVPTTVRSPLGHQHAIAVMTAGGLDPDPDPDPVAVEGQARVNGRLELFKP